MTGHLKICHENTVEPYPALHRGIPESASCSSCREVSLSMREWSGWLNVSEGEVRSYVNGLGRLFNMIILLPLFVRTTLQQIGAISLLLAV